jgi:thiamine pyrophosphokinase
MEGLSEGQAMRQLWGRANELGGEVVEDVVLWLPSDEFGELSHGLVVVFATSAEDAAAEAAVIPTGGLVVAADGGAEFALARGIRVDVAIGDFDSISPERLVALGASGTHIERHPCEKDATDLELALEVARDLRARQVVVVGGGGARLDHLFGQLLLLGAEAYSEMEVDAQFGSAVVHVVRGERVIAGVRGELVSLFALHGPAHGVVTDGLVYPLLGETLQPGSTRGVSNVFAESEVRVAVASGVVMVVRPSGSVAGGS